MVPLALAASVRQLQQRAASAQVALRLGVSVVALAQHLMLPPLQLVTTLVMPPVPTTNLHRANTRGVNPE